MRYRALDKNGDYSFGQGKNNFLINSPAAVAQLVKTRLLLDEGEWFLDLTEGTAWETEVLGAHTENTYDLAIRSRILETQGVIEIVQGSYSSIRNPTTRELVVSCTINTIYGLTPLSVALPT